MGEVYLAQQNFPIKRKVALKYVRVDLLASEGRARFQVECQTMALLNHPYIVKFFDSGVSKEGRPYFVLEFVDGIPLDDFLKKNMVTATERIKIFHSICEAISYAHENLIYHRDLKPSNILIYQVNDKALPKIIDFGIAKLADPNFTVAGTPNTQTGLPLGSPGYLCPEVLEGKKISNPAALDVYSLGAILYEILVGKKPYQETVREGAPIYAYVHAAKTKSIPFPSKVIPRNQLDQGDITLNRFSTLFLKKMDWICVKALCPSPGGRYSSVQALLDDLQAASSNQTTSVSFIHKLLLSKKKELFLQFSGFLTIVALTIISTRILVSSQSPIAELTLNEKFSNGYDRYLDSLSEAPDDYINTRKEIDHLLLQNFQEKFSEPLKNSIIKKISRIQKKRYNRNLLNDIQQTLTVEMLVHEPYGQEYFFLDGWISLGTPLYQDFYFDSIILSQNKEEQYTPFQLQLFDGESSHVKLDLGRPPFDWYLANNQARMVIFGSTLDKVLSFFCDYYYDLEFLSDTPKNPFVKGALIYNSPEQLLVTLKKLFPISIDQNNRTLTLHSGKTDYYPIFNVSQIEETDKPLLNLVEYFCAFSELRLDAKSAESIRGKKYTYHFRSLTSLRPWQLIMKEVMSQNALGFYVKGDVFYVTADQKNSSEN